MNKQIELLRDILLLKDEAFRSFRSLPNVLEIGLIILISVSLLVGLASSVDELVSGVSRSQPTREEAKLEARESIISRAGLRQLPANTQEMIIEYAEIGIDMGFDIAALDTPLAPAFGSTLGWVKDVVNAPLRRMAGWAIYSAVVLLFAKWLGGAARLRTMLGCTALSFLPRLLGMLEPVPFLGGLAAAVGWAWGVVILVKATAEANELSLAKGIFAVILPWVVLLAIALVSVPVVIATIIYAAS